MRFAVSLALLVSLALTAVSLPGCSNPNGSGEPGVVSGPPSNPDIRELKPPPLPDPTGKGH